MISCLAIASGAVAIGIAVDVYFWLRSETKKLEDLTIDLTSCEIKNKKDLK